MTILAGFIGSVAALVAVGIVVAIVARPLIAFLLNLVSDWMVQRMTRDPYGENLFAMVNVLRRVGPQTFGETAMRARQGVPPSRPLGSPLQPSPWDALRLQPVYLKPRLPTPEKIKIGTATVIGPAAGKPLKLEIPIIMAAMSYGGALSVEAKLAIARGASRAGTATNSGESYLAEERKEAHRLILQHHRGLWPNSTMHHPEWLDQADAIEIQIGQGAQAAAAMRTPAKAVSKRMADVYGLRPGEDAVIATRFHGVNSPDDFIQLVQDLKQRHEVPVGVKFGASDHLEGDLEVCLEAGADFITVDGAEGGTHGGPPILQDDLGIPTLYAIARADRYLRKAHARDRVSLLAAGQLTTPGRVLKALALGADAAYQATSALIAVLSSQMTKVLPGEPPPDLILARAASRWNRRLDVEEAANRLAMYLTACMTEIRLAVQALGYERVQDVSRNDLAALDFAVAELCGVRYAGQAWVPDELEREPDWTDEPVQTRGRKPSGVR